MDKLAALLKDIHEQLLNEDSLIDQYSRQEGRTPLDVLVEKESRREIVGILQWAMKQLGEDDRKILYMYAVENRSQEDIARILRIPQQTVSYRIRRIPSILQKHLVKVPYFDNYYEGNLIIKKTYEAGAPTPLGYPHDHLKAINAGGRWGTSQGRKVYVSRQQCVIPEYLETSFGDNRTVCTLCDKCSRR